MGWSIGKIFQHFFQKREKMELCIFLLYEKNIQFWQ